MVIRSSPMAAWGALRSDLMRTLAVVVVLVVAACGSDDGGSDDVLADHLVQSGMSEDIVDCVIEDAEFTEAERDELLSVDDVDDAGPAVLAKMDRAVIGCV